MKKELFAELLASVEEGGAILRGKRRPSRAFPVNPPEIRAMRERYGLTQERFATLMGISVATLRNWEQGRRHPEGSAQVLLRVVARYPKAVLDTVFPETEPSFVAEAPPANRADGRRGQRKSR